MSGSYTVKDGDILFDIAQRLLGDGNRWTELKNATGAQIKNPAGIRPGDVIYLT